MSIRSWIAKNAATANYDFRSLSPNFLQRNDEEKQRKDIESIARVMPHATYIASRDSSYQGHALDTDE